MHVYVAVGELIPETYFICISRFQQLVISLPGTDFQKQCHVHFYQITTFFFNNNFVPNNYDFQ